VHPGHAAAGVGRRVAGQDPGNLGLPREGGRVDPPRERTEVGLRDEGQEPGADRTAGVASDSAQNAGEPVHRPEPALARAITSQSAASAMSSRAARHNATDRGRNARKGRKAYRFSKDWQVHEAMTYLTLYSYNFC
jgi:hypothetical protein